MAEDVRVTREIAAPPERVWALISDVTRMGEWSPETTSCSWRGGATGPALGARFVGRNRSGWRRWSTGCRVVACEQGRTFAFDVDTGPIGVARWGYEIEPTDGGCRVTETWVDRRAGIVRTITGPLTGVTDRPVHNRATMEATLDRLAAVAESTDA